ncbi:disease resistance protein L6-like isoform X2 [Syzygium oleosum]|uniref:disease resistance protein L6-like isoform X2 n=1 Tax=Syzygium oleosum TaxID=219896 RepID=UPI0024B97732|nr:disease resistance protein L6-like isoform X2 [Syzygium oleosum]
MHHPIFGHSFAELVAPILLLGLAIYFLNKKKASVHKNAENANIGASGSLTAPTGTNSGGSSSSPTEINNGASSSSTVPTGNRYEVFLNFRGPDTRKGFTDHLYNGLVDAGIRAFRDDEELRQGEEIGPDLLAAIKNSKILIPILSENYGSSKWCLDELVQIMECKNDTTGTIVLPIFYKVEPADVRYQKGSFGDAFRTREKYSNPSTLEKWKQALIKVCSLKAWEAKGYEGELVKSVVQQVLFELKKKFELVIPENLIGIDSHVKKIMEFVDNNSRATLFVGIYGMGGIGKTTLAKTIYNKLSNQFEHRSFIADIRESWKRNGIHYLQNQLIHGILNQENQVRNEDEGIKFLSSMLKGKKALVLLDDVDDNHHLKALAGNQSWFSSGSMIFITTRNKSILDNTGVDYQYEHEEMDRDNSLILFSRHAFRRDSPPSEFEDLTHDVVSTTGGLPLSLEVLGSFLCGKEPKLWRGTTKKLRKVPHEKVQEKLRISYEALTHEQKQIFLDIACFFIGTDKSIASYMWDACDFFPEEGIEVLRFLSLIKVGDNDELIMHDQLRDLGREIVREENKTEPGNRSRLWDSKEVLEVLKGNEGTRKIEALSLGEWSTEERYTAEQFKEMTNLRFLQADGANFTGDFQSLLPKLRWLQWKGCPSDFVATNFHPKKLVVLDLSNSEISEDWGGWAPLKAVIAMVQQAMQYVDQTTDLETKIGLIKTLNSVAVGKVESFGATAKTEKIALIF